MSVGMRDKSCTRLLMASEEVGSDRLKNDASNGMASPTRRPVRDG